MASIGTNSARTCAFNRFFDGACAWRMNGHGPFCGCDPDPKRVPYTSVFHGRLVGPKRKLRKCPRGPGTIMMMATIEVIAMEEHGVESCGKPVSIKKS